MFFQSSAPYISNDLFLFYSDILFTEQYSYETANKMINDVILDKTIVVFVKTELLFYYYRILLNIPYKYILITTCNDDFCVPYIHFPCKNDIKNKGTQLLECPQLIQWYTKNPCILHPKLKAIPSGVKWLYHSHDFFGEDKKPIIEVLNRYCLSPKANFENDLKVNLLYFNFGKTNYSAFFESHQDIRGKLEDMFLEKGFKKNEPAQFENYLQDLRSHKFSLCPPGRGIDTHRIWETLMVGTIPVLISSPLDPLFEHLPVLILSDWSIITETYLNEKYTEIRNSSYDYSILYSDYWKELFRKI